MYIYFRPGSSAMRINDGDVTDEMIDALGDGEVLLPLNERVVIHTSNVVNESYINLWVVVFNNNGTVSALVAVDDNITKVLADNDIPHDMVISISRLNTKDIKIGNPHFIRE